MTVSTAAATSRAGAGTGRHIVSFSGPVPADFAARVNALGGTVLWTSPGSGLAAVSGLGGSGPASLAAGRGIQTVDADAAIALEMPQAVTADAADATGGLASNAAPAAARFFALQWNMRAVQADVAWAHGALGSSNVSVFMLDSGIDYLHLDLLGRVDLTRSIDLLGTFLAQAVVNGDTVVVPFTEADTVAKYFAGRQPFTDLFFHGTHTAATVSSNAVRAAGITSGTTLVAVKVCGYIDVCPFSSILNGVIYAVQNGADVINMSLGGGFARAGNGRFVGLLQKVFNFARSKGVTIVVSAGNDAANLNRNGNTYATFCDTPGVICVSATGPTIDATGLTTATGPWTNIDAPAFYSDFGSPIDVAAPGGNQSAGPPLAPPAFRGAFVWAACSQTIYPPLAAHLGLSVCLAFPGVIVSSEGTSMAAPHVTGTAALLVSTLGRSPARIKARIEQTADHIDKRGESLFYGHGRVNVARAVGAIP
ncbi:MAG TPA: S8 family serine peptidase [Gemmatimonadales bacterium]|nr:S8 family serine peptidase [Gemmatimonadales bacterium]